MSAREPVAAIATSTAADAALSVIRMTGEGCWKILELCLRKKGRGMDLGRVQPRRLAICEFVDPKTGGIIDLVTVLLYRAPHSYTGEDSSELMCHGGRGLTRRILDVLLDVGFSLAPHGEFTRRAFLNGKLDLSQAEAVAAATAASSSAAAQSAARGLLGETSVRIRAMSENLLDLLSLLEANLDLSEEGIDLVPADRIRTVLAETDAVLTELLRHADRAGLLAGSVRVALVGKPNVGKSTLFNRLAGSDRAIVSDIPGTTRDVNEARIEIDGVIFDLLDTAGLRPTRHPIESEGIERAHRAALGADLVLLVLDATSIETEDVELADTVSGRGAVVVVLNKTDRINGTNKTNPDPHRIQKNGLAGAPLVRTVGISPGGVEMLRTALAEFGRERVQTGSEIPIWISARQAECLRRAKSVVARARDALDRQQLTEEFLSADIREAVEVLEEFGGRHASDDVLNKIFSNFCVGK